MRTSSVLSSITELTGRLRMWSHGKIEKRCLEAGQNFVKIAKENEGKLTINDLNEIYRKILPKGIKIKIVNDSQTAENFLRGIHLKEDTISRYKTCGQAYVVKNFKGETLFFAPIENFSGDKAVNIATHEFEHALERTMTLKAKIQNLIYKILGPKRSEKLALKDSEVLNNKNLDLQMDLISDKLEITNPLDGTIHNHADLDGLLKYLGLSSKEDLISQLQITIKKIFSSESIKKNIKYLKVMKSLISDEARAYKLGGQIAKKYIGLQEESTMSEITSQLYSETASVMKAEIKAQRKKRIKTFIGC